MTNASQVKYTGIDLNYIGVTSNQQLDIILQEINTAVNSSSSAPNYSGYNLYCVKQIDGTTHPTNTQNFAEGISKNLCDFHTEYSDFVNTSYPADIDAFTTAINALQVPGLSYSYSGGGGSITISSGMTRNQVLTATYIGVGSILALLNAPGSTWSSWGISSPTNINSAFNSVITYGVSLTTAIAGKQAAIANFDNSTNCLAGGSSDSIRSTVAQLITYVCSLPTLDDTNLNFGCVTTATTLEQTLNNIMASVTDINTNYYTATGTGLTSTSVGSCSGYRVALDTSYTGLYKTMLSSGDNPADAGFLDAKLESSDGSLNMNISGHKLDITVANPETNKVKINASDNIANYLVDKIPSKAGTWGMAIIASPSPDNSQLYLTPQIIDPALFTSSWMEYVSTDPDLLAQFCALQAQCAGCSCAAPTGLTVALAGSSFDLTWSVGGSPISQTVAYRQRGSADWISNVNIDSPNPQTNSATTSSVDNLDTNIVYQFQINSNCSGVSNGSNVYESIIYQCKTLTATIVGGVISVNQPILPTIDTIQYQLLNAFNVVVDSKTATGLTPNVNFTAQAAGTYHVKWRYGTLINGVTLYSDDASQLGAMCNLAGVIISS